MSPSDPNEPRALEGAEGLRRAVGTKRRRKLVAREKGPVRPWFGLGLFGLIGWSVAVPTLAGVALGLWIDRVYPSRYSWTLTFLALGLVAGCAQAWSWMQRESKVD